MRFQRWEGHPPLLNASRVAIEFFVLLAVFALPFSKSVAEVGIIAAGALWLLRKFPFNENLGRFGPCRTSYILLLGVIALSFVHVPREHFLLVGRGFLKWFKYLSMFFMCAELLRDPARRGRLLIVFLASLTVLSLNGLYQIVSPDHVDLIKQYSSDIPGRDIVFRMRSSLNAPNDLASFLIVGIPLAFFSWYQRRSLSVTSMLRLGVLFLFSACLILTYSRAAFLGLFISIVLFLIIQRRIKSLLLIAGIMVSLLVLSETLRENFLTSLNLSDITVSQRLRFWLYTWEMIKVHPLLGHGVNMYYQTIPTFTPPEETFRGYAHNTYLQLWSEVGIAGLVIFLVPIGYSLWKEWFLIRRVERTLDARSAIFIGLVAYLIQSLADTNFYALQTSFLFWILWGYYWSMATEEESPTSRRPSRIMSRAAAGRRRAS